MRYNYNTSLECFERDDKLGKKYWINMNEAQRVMTLYNLGYNGNQIGAKMNFKNTKFTVSSITNFINNVLEGNIVLDDSVPASFEDFTEMSIESRIQKLEEDVAEFEKRLSSVEKTRDIIENESWMSKVKSWIHRR